MGNINIDWINATPLSGQAGTTTISITASTYDELIDRMATVKASNSEYSVSDSTLITQTINPINEYLTFTIISGGTIEWIKRDGGSLLFMKTISYSKNNGDWISITNNSSIDTVAGDVIKFKGTNSGYCQDHGNYTDAVGFGGSAYFNVSGNVMSLINENNFVENQTITGTFAFGWLFKDTNVVDAENLVLPATATTEGCYWGLFMGCTALTTAPYRIGVSATRLGQESCRNMFNNCTSLTTAPSILLPNNLGDLCYYEMFSGCTSLATVPELPATTMKYGCYWNMFANCTALTSGQTTLPATTLAKECYAGMYTNCSSLTSTVSILPATTLAEGCYKYMFVNCTSLTTAPELPATALTKECYFNMFGLCSNLNYIKCFAKNISATDCTTNWVYGVSANGTFAKNANMTSWTTGSSGIPSGWTVTNYT